jgi:ABC-type uncharacterized transport system fused permease/ATPase subunit
MMLTIFQTCITALHCTALHCTAQYCTALQVSHFIFQVTKEYCILYCVVQYSKSNNAFLPSTTSDSHACIKLVLYSTVVVLYYCTVVCKQYLNLKMPRHFRLFLALLFFFLFFSKRHMHRININQSLSQSQTTQHRRERERERERERRRRSPCVLLIKT